MKFKYFYYFLLIVISGLFGVSCQKWDDHLNAGEGQLNETLLQEISKDPQLSDFYKYLVQTKLDSVLSEARTYTVWAPTNSALAAVSPDILNNPQQLERLLRNHISTQEHFSSAVNQVSRVRAINGKNVSFTRTTFGDANIITADKYLKNGVLNVVDKAIVPKLNIWEFINQETSASSLKATVLAFNDSSFDATKAELLGYNQTTGKPVYKEGTGYVRFNRYFRKDSIDNEDKQFTFFVLSNDAFVAEQQKLGKYFTISGNAAASAKARDSAIVQGLTINGVYQPENMPLVLRSRDNLKLNVNLADTIRSYKASNGIIYVMKKLDYDLVDKLKIIRLEGETGYTSPTLSKVPSIRKLRNGYFTTDSGYVTTFRDLILENAGSAYAINYSTTLNSVDYKVYVRAVRTPNLAGTADTFKERIAFKTATATDLPYFSLTLLPRPLPEDPSIIVNTPNYDEILLGTYRSTEFAKVPLYLVANSISASTLLLDYIRLVPVP